MKAWQNALKTQMNRTIIKRTIRNMNNEEKEFNAHRADLSPENLHVTWPNIKWSNECRMTNAQRTIVETLLDAGVSICCAVINKRNNGTAILMKESIMYTLIYEDGRVTRGRIPAFIPDQEWTVRLNKTAPLPKLSTYSVKRYK